VSAADYQWKLEPHVCAACFGRVAGRLVNAKGEPTRREFRCTVCAATWSGSVTAGCACGMKVGNRDAGIRCVRNPNPRPELLAEFIAEEMS
jgi:hypothetical protein